MKKFTSLKLETPYFGIINNDVVFINKDRKIETAQTKKIIDGYFNSLEVSNGLIFATNLIDNNSRVYSYPELLVDFQFDQKFTPRADVYKGSDDVIFGIYRDDKNKYWCKFDTNNYAVLAIYPINYSIWKVLDNYIYISFKESIIWGCNLSGEEQWHIDIAIKGAYIETFGGKEQGSVRKLLTYNNLLIVEITGIFLLGINSLTGEILWEEHFDNSLFFTCCQEANRIHAFSYGTYYEIDIETGEILRKKSLELELQARDCSPASHTAPAVNEKYIAIAPGFKPKALLIDRATLEIVQELDLKGSYVNNSEILQFHDNRLYILDAHNNLHIFEDE